MFAGRLRQCATSNRFGGPAGSFVTQGRGCFARNGFRCHSFVCHWSLPHGLVGHELGINIGLMIGKVNSRVRDVQIPFVAERGRGWRDSGAKDRRNDGSGPRQRAVAEWIRAAFVGIGGRKGTSGRANRRNSTYHCQDSGLMARKTGMFSRHRRPPSSEDTRRAIAGMRRGTRTSPYQPRYLCWSRSQARAASRVVRLPTCLICPLLCLGS